MGIEFFKQSSIKIVMTNEKNHKQLLKYTERANSIIPIALMHSYTHVLIFSRITHAHQMKDQGQLGKGKVLRDHPKDKMRSNEQWGKIFRTYISTLKNTKSFVFIAQNLTIIISQVGQKAIKHEKLYNIPYIGLFSIHQYF